MLPVNCGSHADYQNFVVTNLRKYYPVPDALARSTWDIIERFWNLDLSFTDIFYNFINRLWNSDDNHMSPHIHPLKTKVKKPKTNGSKADSVEKVTVALALAGDGTPVVTSHRERKKRICKCKGKVYER